MVDVDAEYLYVKQILRLYEIIGTQRRQIQELLSKGKKDTKINDVGKSGISNRNSK